MSVDPFRRRGIRPTNYFTCWPCVWLALCLIAWLAIYGAYKLMGF
jgi:hypothetical protein